MKFSVIVPVYKVEEYLTECVQSILQQDLDDFELILVDDGSPDNCPAMCDRFAAQDNRVRVIHKQNGGLSDARNVGVFAAKGKYICFVDSDDYLLSQSMLSQLYDVFTKTCSQIVMYGYLKYYQKEKRLENVPMSLSFGLDGKALPECLLALVKQERLNISAWSMAISRSFLLENQLIFKKGIKSEDIEWAIRVFLNQPKLAFCDNSFYAYRKQRGASISSTVDIGHLKDYCSIIEESVNRIQKAENCKVRHALLSYMMYHIMIVGALCYRSRLKKEDRRAVFSRIRPLYKQYITEHHEGKKASMGYAAYSFLGFSPMMWLAGQYLLHRGR